MFVDNLLYNVVKASVLGRRTIALRKMHLGNVIHTYDNVHRYSPLSDLFVDFGFTKGPPLIHSIHPNTLHRHKLLAGQPRRTSEIVLPSTSAPSIYRPSTLAPVEPALHPLEPVRRPGLCSSYTFRSSACACAPSCGALPGTAPPARACPGASASTSRTLCPPEA